MATSPYRRQSSDQELKKERIELRVAPSAKQLMVLIGADRDAFLHAVMNPPAPTEKLLAALKRHREVLGSHPRGWAFDRRFRDRGGREG